MNALLVWHIRALVYRLAGAWGRRHMRRQAAPLPRIIIVTAPARPDPHTATLRRRFATGMLPHGWTRPLLYHEYARIARAVRAEHEGETKA